MRRLIVLLFAYLSFSTGSKAYVNVDFDIEGATLAYGAYAVLAGSESLSTSDIKDILEHYTSAEVATAGIWLSKWMDRKALKDEGIFGKTENHYYKAILFLVEKRILPRIFHIGRELLSYPEQFLYWGPFLFKTCDDVMNLCAQFEAIVCNGKLSFSHVDFIQLNPALMEYFDFSKIGRVNWQDTWDRITNFPSPKREDFKEDFKKLFSKISPVNLAIAGEENIRGRASHIFDRFAEAPNSIPDLLNQVQDAFQEVTSGAAIRSILEGTLGDLKDSLAVHRLFNLSQYNVGSYINDYLSQLKGQFYTQRWTIYHGSNNSNIQPTYYTETYRIVLNIRNSSEKRDLYSETYDSRSNNLANFEMAFSTKVNRYSQDYSNTGTVSVVVDGKVYHDNPAYHGQGYKIIDYEEVFDSQKDHEAAFANKFEQRLQALQRGQPSTRFYLEKGNKEYYNLEDAETVKNTGTASFTVTCHDEIELVNSAFNFKVNESYDASRIRDYAYPPGSVAQNKRQDTRDLERKMNGFQNEINSISVTIDKYNHMIDSIRAYMYEDFNIFSIKYREGQRKIEVLNNRISNLRTKKWQYQDSLELYNSALNEMEIDYNENFVGDYRIPAVENELAGQFRLHWDNNGSWTGLTYTRYAHIVGMNSSVKFVAECHEERGESYFLGIRIHRAIISVEYRLVSETETSDIVDVLTFTDDLSDKQKAELINNRRSELQQEYPSCIVKVEKSENTPPEKDNDDAIHLLWMSDRVNLARFIEYRLRQIDGQLALIERNLYTKRNILEDFKRAFMEGIPRWRTSNPYGAALQRWLDNSRAATTKHSQP